MSTLTDVIAHPATAAQELDKVRGACAVLRADNAILRRRVKRLEWTLRAIDTRLHTVAAHEVTFDPSGPQHVMTLPCEDFAQICRVIVAAIGRNV